jgi:thymidine phosphorylase
VKVGRGAFMQGLEEAERLAEALVQITSEMGRSAVAWITRMDDPLGRAVGNAVEIEESIAYLAGEERADLHALALALGGEMLALAGAAPSLEAGAEKIAQTRRSGRGLDALRAMIAAHGGDAGVVDDPSRLGRAAHDATIAADRDGIVRSVNARLVGIAATRLGAGRERAEDVVSPHAGVLLHRAAGERVRRGDALATILADDAGRIAAEREGVAAAFEIGDAPPAPRPLLLRRVTRDGSGPAPELGG